MPVVTKGQIRPISKTIYTVTPTIDDLRACCRLKKLRLSESVLRDSETEAQGRQVRAKGCEELHWICLGSSYATYAAVHLVEA